MKYLSVCSGIEAATVAWHPLGWKPFAFAEIEKFPSAVLAHHYPHVPNLGDMTKFKDWPDADIDVLVGGTPCQSFSVAGLRKGMADPRGNLALTYLAIADRYKPNWIIWENVPGVLSSNEGRDFGAFLGGLGELRYGFAYGVRDAQYVRVDGFARAVPQRRRRVFVVGYLGDWRRAAAVLFERESLLWDTPPRRQAGERVAPTISSRPTGGGGLGTDFDCDGGLIASTGDISHCPNAGAMGRNDYESETMIAAYSITPSNSNEDYNARRAEKAQALTGGGNRPSARGGDVIAFDCKASGQSGFGVGEVASTMRAMGHANSHTNGGGHQAVAFKASHFTRDKDGAPSIVAPPLSADADRGDQDTLVHASWAVRRLMPVECERLQGFPDGYTAIPKAADGPRYKALGNSMPVNVMRWLGKRIDMVSALSSQERQTP